MFACMVRDDQSLFFATWAGSDNEQDEDDCTGNTSADAILRDFRYKLQCMFMEPQRDLRAGVAKYFF